MIYTSFACLLLILLPLSKQDDLRRLIQENPEKALPKVQVLVQENPSIETYLLMAQSWSRVDAHQSLPWLEKVFQLDPEHRDAWQLWADIMSAGRQHEFAIFRLEQQLERKPESAYLQLLLARLCVSTNAFLKAEQAFHKVAEIDPSDLKQHALYSLGYLYQSLGRVEEGILHFRKALEVNASFIPALTGLAELLINLGRWDDVGSLLDRARDVAPQNLEVLMLMGRYHLEQGEWERAAAILQSLLSKEPDHLQGHFFLARTYREAGDLVKAREQLEIFQELKLRARAETLDRYQGLAIQGGK
ncbi:MAG: tetratricopeptide repeat protein [Acidobacteriota bacterium]